MRNLSFRVPCRRVLGHRAGILVSVLLCRLRGRLLLTGCFLALVIGCLIGALLALLLGQIIWLLALALLPEVLTAVPLHVLARDQAGALVQEGARYPALPNGGAQA